MDALLKSIAEDNWLTQIQNYVPSAWIGHAPFLKYLIKEVKPDLFVELGTHNGFSYFVGCQTIHELKLPTKAFAVDHWLGDEHAGKFDQDVYRSVATHNVKFECFSKLLKMTFLEARDEVPDQINLLHIDGLHTYEAVKEDFETWHPKMHQDGIILLHDIHVRHADFGVHILWSELKKKYKTIEFTGSYGLGVVFLGNIPGTTLPEIMNISERGYLMQIQGVFGGLGDGAIQQYRLEVESEFQHKLRQVNDVNVGLENKVTQLSDINLGIENRLIHSELQWNQINLHLELMQDSRSWKYTAPLRHVLRFLREWIN